MGRTKGKHTKCAYRGAPFPPIIPLNLPLEGYVHPLRAKLFVRTDTSDKPLFYTNPSTSAIRRPRRRKNFVLSFCNPSFIFESTFYRRWITKGLSTFFFLLLFSYYFVQERKISFSLLIIVDMQWHEIICKYYVSLKYNNNNKKNSHDLKRKGNIRL